MPVYFIHSIPFMGKVPHNVRRKGRRHFLSGSLLASHFRLAGSISGQLSHGPY